MAISKEKVKKHFCRYMIKNKNPFLKVKHTANVYKIQDNVRICIAMSGSLVTPVTTL